MVALLEDLDRRGITYCVASNGTRERIEASLRAAGLLPRFADRLFSAEQVAHPKPAGDLFLHAARTLGAVPSECLVIEDTPPGIAAARAARMVAWATASTCPADELLGADWISPSVGALGAALRDKLGSSQLVTSPEQETGRASKRHEFPTGLRPRQPDDRYRARIRGTSKALKGST